MSYESEDTNLHTTGDVARLTGVSVRTVQYYDTKNLLVPSEVSDGGRRLYSERDVERMRVILFLKSLGFKLEQIRSVLTDEHPENVIVDLLDRQMTQLKNDITEQRKRLDDCLRLRRALSSRTNSPISLTDMATVMNATNTNGARSLRTTHLVMFLIALPASPLWIACLIIGIITGIWWPLPIAIVVAVALATAAVRYYHARVRYLCPSCHTTFQPGLREFLFAAHTPRTRKLACPSCSHFGHCTEISV